MLKEFLVLTLVSTSCLFLAQFLEAWILTQEWMPIYAHWGTFFGMSFGMIIGSIYGVLFGLFSQHAETEATQ